MKFAFNDNGILRDVVQTPPALLFDMGYAQHFITVPDDAQTGWLWDGHLASPPPTPVPVSRVPATITRAQAKLALLAAGLLDSVQPTINAIADPVQRAAAQIEWDDRLTFERSNPTLVALATAMGMTSDELDALFVAAASL